MVIGRTLFPVLNVSVALLAADQEWGILPRVPVSYWGALVGSVLVLDLGAYAVHRLFHAVPALWRLRRVHHADPDCDFTTGLRFHPLEGAMTGAMELVVIATLGAPVGAVVIREVLIVAHGSLAHANVRLWDRVDRLARGVLVTPDMHRVHHSAMPAETDSNFGIVFPVFGTYRAEPSQGHAGMTIGLAQFRDPEYLMVHWMLALPFLPTRRRH